MANKTCSCKEFEELRGASAGGYISAFLEVSKDDKNRFVCKVCGSIWEKHKSADSAKPSLVKITPENNELAS